MKCPRCVEEGRTSKVYPGAGTVPGSIGGTAGPPVAPQSSEHFYDEEGRYHVHDPNQLVTPWRCSNGHTGRIRSPLPCQSCDYGHNETVEVKT